MRTISLREPVVRAMLSCGFAVVGRNWPNQANDSTLEKMLGPVGIHVSRQGTTADMHRMREVAVNVMKLKMGEVYAPFGRVVASAQVLSLVSNNMPRSQVVSNVMGELLAQGLDVSRALIEGGLLMSMSPDPQWWWVMAHPKPCKPVPWRGVMSQFPVPDEVFNG